MSSVNDLDKTDVMLLQHPEMWGNDYPNAYKDIVSNGYEYTTEEVITVKPIITKTSSIKEYETIYAMGRALEGCDEEFDDLREGINQKVQMYGKVFKSVSITGENYVYVIHHKFGAINPRSESCYKRHNKKFGKKEIQFLELKGFITNFQNTFAVNDD